MGLEWKWISPSILVGCCNHVTCQASVPPKKDRTWSCMLIDGRWLVAWRSWTAVEFEHHPFLCYFTQKRISHSLKLTARPWKWMVGRWDSFWDDLFSGANYVTFREGTHGTAHSGDVSPDITGQDRGNAARQTSLHTACEGNYANIAVELLAAGWRSNKNRNPKEKSPVLKENLYSPENKYGTRKWRFGRWCKQVIFRFQPLVFGGFSGKRALLAPFGIHTGFWLLLRGDFCGRKNGLTSLVGVVAAFHEAGGFPFWKFGIKILVGTCGNRCCLVLICSFFFPPALPNKKNKQVGRCRCWQAGQSQANASSSGGAQWSSWLHPGPAGRATPHRLKLMNSTWVIQWMEESCTSW